MMRQECWVSADFAFFQNILFGLKKSDKTDARAKHFLALTGLEGLGDRYPHEISGGQMQRVALARTLAPEPGLTLMDEPFNNLDIRIKRNMLEEVGDILRKTGTSCLFITHEKDEAFILADRISVMRTGEILQVANPQELYNCPGDTYVAEFFGGANHIPVQREEGLFRSPFGNIEIPKHIKLALISDHGFLVHRPWDMEITKDGPFQGKIIDSHFLGDYQEVWFQAIPEVKGGEAFKFFTHIVHKFKKNEAICFNIPVERLTFCQK